MANDVGESVSSINDRYDGSVWPQIYVAMTRGAILYRPTGLSRYFTKCKNDRDPYDGIGISAKFVKFQAEHGCLVRVGVDTYGLDGQRVVVVPAAEPIQMQLFSITEAP